MAQSQYIFQRKRTSFTKRLFTKGLTAASIILLYLGETGEGFLEELPSCYPQFDSMKRLARVGPYRKQRLKKKTFQDNTYRLKKLGLIAKDPQKKVYYLTDEGKKFTAYIEDRYGVLSRKWDGKVRVVIFDIPEKKRQWREWLRSELLLLQYKILQKSVYIGKTPLPKSFYQEVIGAGLGKYVFIFTMSEFDRKQIEKALENKKG